MRRRLVRPGVLAPFQRVRRGPAQLLGRIDVRAAGPRVRVRLSRGPRRQTLRPRRAAVGRAVLRQAVVPVRVRGGAEHATVQRGAGDQAVRRVWCRVLRQTRRGAQKVPVPVAVRRCAGAEDLRPRWVPT